MTKTIKKTKIVFGKEVNSKLELNGLISKPIIGQEVKILLDNKELKFYSFLLNVKPNHLITATVEFKVDEIVIEKIKDKDGQFEALLAKGSQPSPQRFPS